MGGGSHHSDSNNKVCSALRSCREGLHVVWPVMLGVIVALALILAMYFRAGFLNPLDWPLVQYSPTKSIAVLLVLILADIIVIFCGTLVFFRDFQRSMNEHGHAAGNWFTHGQTCATLCLVVIFGWGFCISYFFIMTSNGLKVDSAVSDFVNWNAIFSFVIFAGFAVCDYFNAKGCSATIAAAQKRKAPQWHVHLLKNRETYCWNAVWLVDAPVLIGSVLLFVISKLIISGAFGDLGLQHLGDIQEEHLKAVIRPFQTPGGTGTMAADQLSSTIQLLVARDFDAGFSTGALICELAFSQVVFMILNFRLSKFERNTTRPHTAKAGHAQVIQ
jgi:hypothetical protein